MSRALAKDRRVGGDAYYTPDQLALKLVGLLPLHRGDRVWEPHVGGGAFARELVDTGAAVTVSDIDPDAIGLRTAGVREAFVADFLHHDGLRDQPRWIIGNPPYGAAQEHVEWALTVSDNVAFLLRLGFLESEKRAAFWKAHRPRKVWVLTKRPSFTGGGTDSAAYGWFWWDRTYDGPTILDWVSW